MTERSGSLAVVIVTYNGMRWMEACLDSLQATPEVAVYIVDNGSRDGTVEFVRSRYPQVDVTCLEQNLGFGGGNNVGIQRALDGGADYVMLLNQDIIVAPETLYRIRDCLRKHPELGLASAFWLAYGGQDLDPIYMSYLPAGLVGDLYFGRQRDYYACDNIPAAAVMIPRARWFELGGFDPLFFMYGEDDDLCQRLVAAGWKLGVVPQAVVQHWHGNAHAVRNWKYLKNVHYSRAAMLLKAYEGTLPGGFVALFRHWFFTGRLTPQILWARILGIGKCLRRYRTIDRHRRELPYRFLDACPAEVPLTDNLSAETTTMGSRNSESRIPT